MTPEAELMDMFQRLGLALALGFLVGIERGWKLREEAEGARVAGLRTIALSGLLGGFAGILGMRLGAVAFAALAVSYAAILAAFSFREQIEDKNYSVTGIVAGLLTFAIAAYAQFGSMTVAAGAGIAMVAILAFKDVLHRWLLGIQWAELRSALLILTMTFIVLPVLPNRALDPYGALNPRELWTLTILIAGASFVGYAALRAFGDRAGLLLGAGAGALVSSTVVTLELSARVRAGEARPVLAAAGALLAAAIMVVRIVILTFVFANAAFAQVFPALAAAGAVAVLGFAGLLLASGRSETATPYKKVENPLDLKSVLRFSFVLSVLMIAARIVVHFYGAKGALIFAATGGLVDVDAVTLAIGGLLRQGQSTEIGAAAILLAAAADTTSKAAMTVFAGNRRFAGLFVGGSAAMLMAGGAAYLLI